MHLPLIYCTLCVLRTTNYEQELEKHEQSSQKECHFYRIESAKMAQTQAKLEKNELERSRARNIHANLVNSIENEANEQKKSLAPLKSIGRKGPHLKPDVIELYQKFSTINQEEQQLPQQTCNYWKKKLEFDSITKFCSCSSGSVVKKMWLFFLWSEISFSS